MSEAKPKKCPICDRSTDALFHPFCGKRCSEIDLGRWFSEQYAVPTNEEADESVPEFSKE